MNNTIYRQDAIDALRVCYDTETITYTNGNEYIDYDQALDLLNSLPSAQQERKGHWVYVATDYSGYDWFRCSECNSFDDHDCGSPFCWHCGARMEGDDE